VIPNVHVGKNGNQMKEGIRTSKKVGRDHICSDCRDEPKKNLSIRSIVEMRTPMII
jgi:hypothetical protein